MAYSGKYRVKNRDKYQGDPDNIVFRSLWEKNAFRWADSNPQVVKWSSEEVVVPYLFEADKRVHRYFVDMKIRYKDGRTVLVEIKPHKETSKPKYPGRRTKRYLEESMTFVKNSNKWKAADKYAKERGWKFEIWTEKTLDKMGILPKANKKLKPLPKLKSKKS